MELRSITVTLVTFDVSTYFWLAKYNLIPRWLAKPLSFAVSISLSTHLGIYKDKIMVYTLPVLIRFGGVHKWGHPKNDGLFHGNPIQWMMTGGTPMTMETPI